jgi:hypothetical protein
MHLKVPSQAIASRLSRRRVLAATTVMSSAFALRHLLAAEQFPPAAAAAAATPAAPINAATGDFAGPVDVRGRSLYLECRGQGSPAVILEAGALSRSDIWSRGPSRT